MVTPSLTRAVITMRLRLVWRCAARVFQVGPEVARQFRLRRFSLLRLVMQSCLTSRVLWRSACSCRSRSDHSGNRVSRRTARCWRHNPQAVPFRLEHPVRIIEGRIRQRGQHGLQVLGKLGLSWHGSQHGKTCRVACRNSRTARGLAPYDLEQVLLKVWLRTFGGAR